MSPCLAIFLSYKNRNQRQLAVCREWWKAVSLLELLLPSRAMGSVSDPHTSRKTVYLQTCDTNKPKRSVFPEFPLPAVVLLYAFLLPVSHWSLRKRAPTQKCIHIIFTSFITIRASRDFQRNPSFRSATQVEIHRGGTGKWLNITSHGSPTGSQAPSHPNPSAWK